MSLIDIALGPGLPGPTTRRLGDVRPPPARKGRAALLSRAARASGDGSVAQSGCKIAAKPAASFANVIGEDGLGSMGRNVVEGLAYGKQLVQTICPSTENGKRAHRLQRLYLGLGSLQFPCGRIAPFYLGREHLLRYLRVVL